MISSLSLSRIKIRVLEIRGHDSEAENRILTWGRFRKGKIPSFTTKIKPSKHTGHVNFFTLGVSAMMSSNPDTMPYFVDASHFESWLLEFAHASRHSDIKNVSLNALKQAEAKILSLQLPPHTTAILQSTLRNLTGRGICNYTTWMLDMTEAPDFFRMAQYILTHIVVPGK